MQLNKRLSKLEQIFNMRWTQVEDQERWTAFIKEHGPHSGSFLHSWQWGEFQKSVGKKVHRYAWGVEGKWRMVAQFIEEQLPAMQTYLYCPRGPIFVEQLSDEMIMQLFGELRSTHGAMFVRFDWPREFLSKRQIIQVPTKSPATTLITDLAQTEEELFAGMHQKTRYNIRLAEKKGVEVHFEGGVEEEEVKRLFEETAKRGKFRLHPWEYYEEMMRSLRSHRQDCHAHLAGAYVEDKLAAVVIMIDYNNVRTYLHGASDYAYRQSMAPYLLHWKLIQRAKEVGMRSYDWWGISPEGAGQEHPWSGVTRFKKGFAGEVVQYAGTFEYVLSPTWYGLYNLVKKYR
jgi:peptidoglycan pentaglycine glycine transferase (the first glycine)